MFIYFIVSFHLDEETGCAVGDYTVFSRRRWNYENNCAAIVCYVSTGLASSSTQLMDLSDDIIHRHRQLSQTLTADNITEILMYTVNKLLKAKGAPPPLPTELNAFNQLSCQINCNCSTTQVPAIHLKIFYQVSAVPPIELLIQTIADFKKRCAAQTTIAFTVLPACSLQNFSTFLSICGIRHE